MTKSYDNFGLNELAYSSYRLIERYLYENGALPSGLYFNKGLSYINSEMKKKGKNIMLPHCWYRWGDEVVRYYMPRNVTWTHEETSYTIVGWKGAPVTLSDDRMKNKIDTAVDEFIGRYSVKTGHTIEELLADHYDGAPFEFQRLYKTCRDTLLDRKHSANKNDDFVEEILIPLFQKAFSTFPDDKLFQPVADFIPAFIALIEYGARGSLLELDTVNEISEEFWYWFCYFLRIHPSAHENVNKDTLVFWRSKLEIETERFYRNFDNHVATLSSKYPEISNNEILLPHLNEGRKRIMSLQEKLDEFDEVMGGFDEFLAEKSQIKPKHFGEKKNN